MAFSWQFLICSCFFLIHSVSAQCCLNHVVFGGTNQFIDLTFPFDERTLYFHVEGNFTLIKNSENKKWPPFRVINAPEHGGTHVDAPYFFDEHGIKIAEIPTDKLITQLIIVDISSKVNGNSNYVLNMKDVEAGIDEETMEHMSRYNSLIVFKFGWGKYYHSDPEKYLGYNKEKDAYITPTVGKDVAEWVAANDNGRKLVGIGVDLAAADTSTSEESFQVHKILAKAGQYTVGGLNLEPLNVTGHNCTAVVLPMKITEAAGSPANVVAICPTIPYCNDQDQSGTEQGSMEGQEHGHHGCKHGCHHNGSKEHGCHHGHGGHSHGGHGHGMHGQGGHGHSGHKEHENHKEHGDHEKQEEHGNHEHEKHEMHKHHEKEQPNKHETHEHETDKKQPDATKKPEEIATTQKPTGQEQSQGKPQNIIDKISQIKEKFTGK